jgi:NTE family protein
MRTTVTFSVRSCLRALDDRDLLAAVRVVSGISGGAVLAAMWA